MPNITLSLEDKILKGGREYAKKHNTSLNHLIRNLLAKTVTTLPGSSWLTECFRLMDRSRGNSRGKRWKREDLYRV